MKQAKKLLSLILTLVLTLSISVPAAAANNEFVNATPLAMNGQTVETTLTNTITQRIYKINVTQTGRVNLNFTKYLSGNAQCYLVDTNETDTIELID